MVYKRRKADGTDYPYWYYKFKRHGIKVVVCTKQGDEDAARKMEAEHRTRLALGEVGLRPGKARSRVKRVHKQLTRQKLPSRIEMSNNGPFIVYSHHFAPDCSDRAFYKGCGRWGRAFDDAKVRNEKWRGLVGDRNWYVSIIAVFDTKKEALKLESELIFLWQPEANDKIVVPAAFTPDGEGGSDSRPLSVPFRGEFS